MRIGEQLQSMRKGAGLTQEAVAEKLHVTRQAVSNWEQSKTAPDLFLFAQLAALYRFSPDEFLLGQSYSKGALKMKTNFSDAQIEQFIQAFYPEAGALTPLSGGLVSQTFLFHSDGQKYVFQIGGAGDDYAKQRYVGKQYSDTIPVRETLYVRETSGGIAYSISRYIQGCKLFDLTDRERRRFTAPVMETLSRLGQAAVPANSGYGHFDGEGRAPYKTWVDFIAAIYNDSVCDWSGLAIKGLSDTVVNKAISKLHGNIGCIQLDRPGLVHGDLGSYNIIANKGQIAGLIDCGMALYGDPLYDAANLLFWNEKKLEHLIEQIRRNYFADQNAKQKLYCYTLRIGLEEIYNTVILNGIGYDVEWVHNRLSEIVHTDW